MNLAALETSTNGTTGTSVLASTPTTKITVTWNCNGSVSVTNATVGTTTDPTSSSSDSVRAQVDYSFHLITPLIGTLMGASGQIVHIRTDVRGRAEY